MVDVLVRGGDVVEDVALVFVHFLDAVVQQHGDLVRERRIVGAAVRHRGGHQLRGGIRMLQAFAGETRTRGRADQESARALVARGPDQVADATEAEERVVDEERQHRLVRE